MRFEEALKAMREGKKVKRPRMFVPREMKKNVIYEVYKSDDGRYNYVKTNVVYNTDIIAEDWEVVEDENIY